MPAQFDFSAYLDSVSRAFDISRASYRLVLVLCAALVVFVIQGEPYKGSRKYLSYLTTTKATIDEASGWIKGIRVVQDATNEPALSESIHEAEYERLQQLADLYVTIKGIPDEVDQIVDQLKEEKLTEKEVSDALAAELAKQYQFGVAAGLKVPLLDVVIERERVPALFSVLVAVFVGLLAVSVENFKHAFTLFLSEVEKEDLAKKACDLLMMRGLAMLLPRGNVNDRLQPVLLWLMHLAPAALVGYAITSAWADSSNLARFVYCAGLLMAMIAGSTCSRSWISIRVMAKKAASKSATDVATL